MILQDKITKKDLLEFAVHEQVKGRQEMEKKLQKLAKTMDYMERAKREEEAPLIEQAYQQRLVEEKILHEHEQLVCFAITSLVVYVIGYIQSFLVIYESILLLFAERDRAEQAAPCG